MSNPTNSVSDLEFTIVADPLESVFGIEAGTTPQEITEVFEADHVVTEVYDDKDVSIDDKFEEVYSLAIASANATSAEIQFVEGKYKPRLSETTAQMLGVALAAAQAQSRVKEHKDKLSPEAKGVTVTNNNVIFADRNEALALLRAQREAKKAETDAK